MKKKTITLLPEDFKGWIATSKNFPQSDGFVKENTNLFVDGMHCPMANACKRLFPGVQINVTPCSVVISYEPWKIIKQSPLDEWGFSSKLAQKIFDSFANGTEVSFKIEIEETTSSDLPY